MKYLGITFVLIGFFLIFASVGTMEYHNMVGWELAIWFGISLIGILTFAMGAMITCKQLPE